MKRASKLPAAEHCGFAGSYADSVTGVAGLKGDAFHAANHAHWRPSDETREARAVALGQLSDEDRADVLDLVAALVAAWTPVESARFEVPVGLDRNGLFVEHGDPTAITCGTADCTWATEEDDDTTTAWVLDFKSGPRAAWNVDPAASNLQLAAYGFALADKYGAARMKLGIYRAHDKDRPWDWATVHLDSTEATELFARVRAAALRADDEQVVGAHCGECFVRLKCPAHILPALDDPERDHALLPMSAGAAHGGVIEPARLVRLLNAVKAMEDMADAGKEWAKAYVREHGPIVADGKQWGPVPMKGRESTSIKKLKESGLYARAVAVGAVSPGAATEQYRWTNAKG